MLIELISRHNAKTSGMLFPISNVAFKRLSEPILETDLLVASEYQIPVFSGWILYFNILPDQSSGWKQWKAFSFEKMNETSPFLPPFQITAFDSVYPCTNILAVYNGECLNYVLFEFAVDQKREHVLKDLKRMQPDLSLEDESLGPSKRKKQGYSMYVIKAVDGDIPVDISALKRENTTGMYLNKNKVMEDLSSAIESVEVDSQIPAIDMKLDNYKLRSTSDIISIIEKTEINENTGMDRDIPEFEYSNNSDYEILVKAFLKELQPSRYNFIKHCLIQSIETFYFIFIKINDQVTVILSRRLYNFIGLYNYIETHEGMLLELLEIPDLNLPSEAGSILLKLDGNPVDILPLNCKYEIFNFNCINQLELILDYSAVALEENAGTFWFLIKLKEILCPLVFPGLILSPAISNMKYLLDGPYPFIISSEKEVRLDNKLIFTCSSPTWKACKTWKIESRKKPHQCSIKFRDRLAELIKGTETKVKSRARSILEGKMEYVDKLLATKFNLDKFPGIFEASFLIEKFFLNQAKIFPINYEFNISQGCVDIKRGAYLNMSDAVSLWLQIYPGAINLEKLFRKRWISLEFLCRRACIDGNTGLVKKILKKSVYLPGGSEFHKNKSKRGRMKCRITAYRRYGRKRRFYTPRQETCRDILQTICSGLSILDVKMDLVGEIKVVEIRTSYSSLLEYQGGVYRLMRIEDIIGCLQRNYQDDRVIASILAYFTVFNLPLVPCESKERKDDISVYC